MHRDPDADARPDGRDLLDDLEVDLVGLAAAAVLLGIGQAEQTGAAQRAEDLAREGLGGLGLDHPRLELARGDVAHELDQGGGLVGGEQACLAGMSVPER